MRVASPKHLETRSGFSVCSKHFGLDALLTTLLTGLLIGAATFAASSAAGESLDVIFVLDNSGSMRQNDPDALTHRAVSNFAAALAEDPDTDGRVGLVLFDGQARLLRGLTPTAAGQSEDWIANSLSELDFSGQRTNSPAGIERALYELRHNGRADARRAIVLLTDGKIDTGDPAADIEAARWLREDLASQSEASGIRIFGIAFTDAADYQLMQALARRTHASYYRAFKASDLVGVIDDVLAKLAEDAFYELALVDARPLNPSIDSNAALPAVSAAAPGGDSSRGVLLFGLVPIAILLVGASVLWRRQAGIGRIDAIAAQAHQDMDAPPAQLLDIGGHLGESGRAIDLGRGRTRIGRDAHNDIVLDDEAISSEHAVIEVHAGRYWLEDRRSTNGTRLGNKKLLPDQRVQLIGGDHIRLADIDLMFVLSGYIPGGATVFLSSTTVNPVAWGEERSAEDPIQEPGDVVPSTRVEAQPSRERPPKAFPTDVVDLDDRLANESPDPADATPRHGGLSLLKTPIHDDSGSSDTSQLRECLDDHLARVGEISPEFNAFIATAFDDELRSALAVSARELITTANENGRLVQKSYTLNRIRYVICGVPCEMEGARDQFVDAFGGFTRFLAEHLQADSFRSDRCEILALLAFGEGSAPWVSLSLVPDEGQDPRIDLLSYEFLTETERHEIGSNEKAEISYSGMA